jgi:hypothetical protein
LIEARESVPRISCVELFEDGLLSPCGFLQRGEDFVLDVIGLEHSEAMEARRQEGSALWSARKGLDALRGAELADSLAKVLGLVAEGLLKGGLSDVFEVEVELQEFSRVGGRECR